MSLGTTTWFLRRWLVLASVLLVGFVALALPSCDWDGQFTVLGYTTRPNYDTGIHTVRVTIFKNDTFWRGLEFDLGQSLVREIESKTPYKVVGLGCTADTELSGRIISFQKILLNINQLNEVREGQTILRAEVTWTDLRTGEALSAPKPKELPPGVPPPPKPPPQIVMSTGDYIPEVGQSIATAQQQNVNRLAAQIVRMMEKPW
jgi:hypothetical protein